MYARRTTVHYEVVKFYATKRGACPGCGRLVSRQTTFAQTINLFNKRADGAIKDRTDIYRELGKQAEEWRAMPVWHQRCER